MPGRLGTLQVLLLLANIARAVPASEKPNFIFVVAWQQRPTE
jgi:hypothetical protein